MNTLLTIAMKDLKLVARDPLGLFFIIGFPVVMAVFFGSVMGNVGGGSATLEIALVDEDESPMSTHFVESLTGTGNVTVTPMARSAAMNATRRGDLTGLIVLQKGFGETAGVFWEEGPPIQVGVDPSRKAEAAMIEGMIMQVMGELVFERMQEPATYRPLIDEAREEIASDESISPILGPLLLKLMDRLGPFLDALEEVTAEEKAADNRESDGEESGFGAMQLTKIESIDVTRQVEPGSTEALVKKLRSSWDISFPQSMQWGVLACSAGFAVTLVRERKQGTYMRLVVAPVSLTQILAGKGAACFFAVLAVIAMMITIGVFLGMRPVSPGLLVLAAICIAICFVGVMMLMSVIGNTEEAVGGAAWGMNMIMAMFGGAMLPLLFMPSFMKSISHLSPVKWSVLALEGAIWRGFSLGEMILPCAVLVITGGACLAVGVVVLSRRTA